MSTSNDAVNFRVSDRPVDCDWIKNHTPDAALSISYCSYQRNADTVPSEVLVFKLFRTEYATDTVTALPIVTPLDIIKHRRPHYFTTDIVLTVDTFDFQRVEEAFRICIVVTAALYTHDDA